MKKILPLLAILLLPNICFPDDSSINRFLITQAVSKNIYDHLMKDYLIKFKYVAMLKACNENDLASELEPSYENIMHYLTEHMLDIENGKGDQSDFVRSLSNSELHILLNSIYLQASAYTGGFYDGMKLFFKSKPNFCKEAVKDCDKLFNIKK
jgi:hypothetical protein